MRHNFNAFELGELFPTKFIIYIKRHRKSNIGSENTP